MNIKFFSKKHKYVNERLEYDPNSGVSLQELFNARTLEYNKNKNFWNILEDFLDDIRWSLNHCRIEVTAFFNGLYNFWKYRKMIYNDRWWDYAFLNYMLQAKLTDMRDNWKDSHYENCEEEYKTLCELCSLLDKMIEDSDDEVSKNEFFDLLRDNYFKLWD